MHVSYRNKAEMVGFSLNPHSSEIMISDEFCEGFVQDFGSNIRQAFRLCCFVPVMSLRVPSYLD